MEALTASSLKLVLENPKDKDRGFYSPFPKAVGFRVSGHHKYVNPSFSLYAHLPRKTIQPPCSASALSSPESQTCFYNEENQTKDETSTLSKTVHVKFQLRRECSFGQQFLIAGDDPVFGVWDSSNAVPLNWSEGHIWTTELDVPCDKMIKYKFILKDGFKTITWQPGPDRMLQTWETRNTIVVSEDWENAQLQTIIEEDPTAHQLTRYIKDPERLVLTDNLPHPGGDSGSNSNEKPSISDDQPLLFNDDIILDSAAEVTVLVPGLTPIAENEEASVTEVDGDINCEDSHGSDKVEDLSLPKLSLDEDCSNSSSISEEGTALLLNGKTDQHDKGHIENPKLVELNDQLNTKETEINNIHWGRRTLQQFLTILGLL